MKIDVARWVALLPLAEEPTVEGIVLSGWLAPGEDGQADLFVGGLRLSFQIDDLLEIEPEAEDVRPPGSPRLVHILLRRGAPILDIRLDALCQEQPPQLKPFALAVRPSHLLLGPVSRFRDLEREFLLKHGLIDA
jgi:hypothetical protein